MKAYITKFALTKGIQVVEGRESNAGNYFITNSGRDVVYQDWHDDLTAAVIRAEHIRNTKITKLKHQITRLEALDFNAMPVEGK